MLDLTVAIEQQTEQLQALNDQLPVLREEVRVLRQVLDEVRDELGWLLNNREEFRCHRPSERPVMHITSMPKDVSAPDFAERINRYSAKDLPPEEKSRAVPPPATNVQQGELWS